MREDKEPEIPVLIAGAGSTGLTLAAELGQRGIPCLAVESREEVNRHPRASSLNPRSMEHFRRWGIADRIIESGVPLDFPQDVVFTTRLCGHEIHRFSFPTTAEAIASARNGQPRLPELAWSPYPKIQIGQNVIEPIIASFAKSFPGVDIRFGWALDEFCYDHESVTATIVRQSDGRRQTVRARFLVGCDGPKSTVRTKLGIQYAGRGALARNQGIYFRSRQFAEIYGRRMGRLLWTLAPDSRGVFICIDGRGEWTYNRYFAAEDEVLDKTAIWRAVGKEFPLEVISVLPWTGYQLVAERYRVGPVFLAGDAAHLFHPTGGYGMNTAIGDAVDLGWKLAAFLQGWGGEGLLESYEIERRPIAVNNTTEAAGNFDRLVNGLMALPKDVERDDAEGERIRAVARASLAVQRRTWAGAGMSLGYSYFGSPTVLSDGAPPLPMDALAYTPNARPGARAPHIWIEDGVSTLDLFGKGFTLMRIGNRAPATTRFSDAAKRQKIPLEVVDVDGTLVAETYGSTLVLVRPDGHVAWRSNDMPHSPEMILRIASGQEAPLSSAAAAV